MRTLDQSAIGIQFVGACFEDWRWDGTGGYHEMMRQLNPAFVNFMGAAQYKEAFQRATALQAQSPQTRILWRHMKHQPPTMSDKTDKNMWRLPAQEFVDNVVVAHGYHKTGWYLVTDTEGSINSPEEAKQYAAMQAQVLDNGVQAGARFAVLRTSTHNPPKAWLDAGYFDELFRAVARNMGSYLDPNVVLSMNAYYDDDPDYGNDGLKHIKTIEDRFIKVTGKRPVICLGELGYDKKFTSEAGWRTTTLSAEANAMLMVNRFNEHLGRYGWAACAWCEGVGNDAKVRNFILGSTGIRVLIGSAPRWIRLDELPDTGPLPSPEPEPPVIVPEPPQNDEDTVIIDRTEALREQIAELMLMREKLKLERQVNDTNIELYQIKNKLVDLRNQQVQTDLLEAENKLEQLTEAAAKVA
jgi:hypothetical protein